MRAWETRGYLAYPNHFGKPRAGTPEEISYCRGWSKAQSEALECQKSDYHLSLENDALYGRNTFFAEYDRENNLKF